jgi:hypothetical protein
MSAFENKPCRTLYFKLQMWKANDNILNIVEVKFVALRG